MFVCVDHTVMVKCGLRAEGINLLFTFYTLIILTWDPRTRIGTPAAILRYLLLLWGFPLSLLQI